MLLLWLLLINRRLISQIPQELPSLTRAARNPAISKCWAGIGGTCHAGKSASQFAALGLFNLGVEA
jgi:hypothetical protein